MGVCQCCGIELESDGLCSTCRKVLIIGQVISKQELWEDLTAEQQDIVWRLGKQRQWAIEHPEPPKPLTPIRVVRLIFGRVFQIAAILTVLFGVAVLVACVVDPFTFGPGIRTLWILFVIIAPSLWGIGILIAGR